MSDITPQQQVAYITFKNGLHDIERAARIDSRYAEFWAKVKELYDDNAHQLRP
jgi:hypothetical protein